VLRVFSPFYFSRVVTPQSPPDLGAFPTPYLPFPGMKITKNAFFPSSPPSWYHPLPSREGVGLLDGIPRLRFGPPSPRWGPSHLCEPNFMILPCFISSFRASAAGCSHKDLGICYAFFLFRAVPRPPSGFELLFTALRGTLVLRFDDGAVLLAPKLALFPPLSSTP